MSDWDDDEFDEDEEEELVYTPTKLPQIIQPTDSTPLVKKSASPAPTYGSPAPASSAHTSPDPASPPASADLSTIHIEILRLAYLKGKIFAIKEYRMAFESGLAVAKREVEALMENYSRAVVMQMEVPPVGGSPTPGSLDSDPIMDAIRAGRKIRAIKLYREGSGTSLREAKNHIENVMREVQAEVKVPPQVLADVMQAISTGKKIAAIKIYRDATHVSLSEAKRYVDHLAEQG